MGSDRLSGGDGDATGSTMLIDRHLPNYDATQICHAVVDADPETAYEAMLTTDLTELGPIVGALGRLRNLPRALSDRLGGALTEAQPERLRFVDVAATDEWTKLDEAPGEEFVVGAVGKFWRPSIEWRDVAPDEFADFDEPGYAKLAIGISVRPYGARRSLLTYEARTATTDDRARRNFRRYWRLVGPFAGYLMSTALDRSAAEAAKQERESGDDRTSPSRHRSAGVVALAVAAGYHALVRPWHRRWGTEGDESSRTLPGDELLPDAADQVTHAIEIGAPADDVWPWIVQMGQDRGGFYSYDRIERAVGADIHNADRIVPEHQRLSEGDVVRLAPDDYRFWSPESAPEVARLDPDRAIVLRPPGESPAWTWAFVLDPVDEATTRLLARTRSAAAGSSAGPFSDRPLVRRALQYLFWEPAHFVMERAMLRGVARRAEQRARADVRRVE